MQQRRHILYSGTVQGVGFRFTTRGLARGSDVCGFVRNLSDGRVDVVVEGQPSEIDGFLQAIADHMGGFIRSKDERIEEATGEFSGFDIRF